MNKENRLMHYGVPGMKWGVRRAKMAERANLRRAAGALTDKRKDKFLEKANKNRDKANKLTEDMKKMKKSKVKDINPKKISTGKKIAIGAAAALAGVTVADIVINRKEYKTGLELWKGALFL